MISMISPVCDDFPILRHAIKSWALFADEILIAVERSRRLWLGGTFELPTSWAEELRAAAGPCLVRIVSYDMPAFCADGLGDRFRFDTPLRSALSHICDPENWIVMIDADEVIVNPIESREWWARLSKEPDDHRAIMGRTSTVLKTFPDRGLAIVASGPIDYHRHIGTKIRGQFRFGRVVPYFERLGSPLQLMHWPFHGRQRAKIARTTPYMGKNPAGLTAYLEGLTPENVREYPLWPHGEGKLWAKLELVPLGLVPGGAP